MYAKVTSKSGTAPTAYINGTNVRVYDSKPAHDLGKKTERVVIKDLPATTPPERILAFLKGYSHVTPRSRVLYAKEILAGRSCRHL